MTNDSPTRDADRWIVCVCGRAKIEHSHGNLWKCEACGRFHDGDALDRLAEQSRAVGTDTHQEDPNVTTDDDDDEPDEGQGGGGPGTMYPGP